jgi:hypothetical protein
MIHSLGTALAGEANKLEVINEKIIPTIKSLRL